MGVVTQLPVLIGGYRQGNEKKGPDGKPTGDRFADSVQYIEEGEHGGVRTVELGRAINGDRPEVGVRLRLVLDYFPRKCKRARRDGVLYDATLFEPVVVGFEKA